MVVIPSEMMMTLDNKLPHRIGIPIVAEYEFTTTDSKFSRPKNKLLRSISFPNKPDDESSLLKMSGIELKTIGRISPKSLGYGFSNIFPDSYGVVRKQALAVKFEDMAFPAIEITATAMAKDFTPTIKQSPDGKPAGISLGDISIPTKENVSVTINYRRGSHTFKHFSANELLSANNDKLDGTYSNHWRNGYSNKTMAHNSTWTNAKRGDQSKHSRKYTRWPLDKINGWTAVFASIRFDNRSNYLAHCSKKQYTYAAKGRRSDVDWDLGSGTFTGSICKHSFTNNFPKH